ncbi:endo-1,4-beta-xylanase precursor [Umbelopsis sp. PMI_123]|nr:endo-1,4-beta-xylanase precursor [Umbelopsis sp. PMI_123]
MKSLAILSPLAYAVLASGYTLYSDTTTVNLTASLASFAPKGLYIGAAINPTSDSDPVTDGALLVRKDYNMYVSENDCKWTATEPSQNTFSYSACDAALSFATSVGATFRGHNLCWGSYNPSWLTSGNFNSTQLSAILTNHIKNVAGYYAGKVYSWDVVNEAVADDGSSTPNLKNSTWYPTLPNFVDIAFQAARTADPNAKLIYNDYSAEACGQAKSDAVYALVKDMKSRGIPIDGVGLQMHINTNATSYITRASVGCNIKRLGDLGLEVHITEMDVRCRAGLSDTCDQRLKAYVKIQIAACLDYPGVCKALLTWGYTDKYTWLDTFNNPDNIDPAPLLNNVNGTQVVAWNEFQAVLKVNPVASTTATTTTSTATTTTTTATKTTTSKTTTTTTTTTTTATATASCAAKWGQCAGNGFTGAKCCVSGSTCTYQNDWYSQCL